MADDQRGLVYRFCDYTGFSCILVAVEECGRSFAGLGPPSSWQLWLGFLAAGLVLLWFGSTGPKLRALIVRTVSTQVVKENAELKRRLSESEQKPQKLKIHSAFYGLGNANDVDVTKFLQDSPREALWVWVGNNLIPGIADPAPNLPKKLQVKYSFGGPEIHDVIRSEHSKLVLPEPDQAGLQAYLVVRLSEFVSMAGSSGERQYISI
jgi:hypothetical protein